jgi:hypothetical protein
MTELADLVAAMRRPRLLIRAARHGLDAYDRGRHLGRLTRRGDVPTPGAALAVLIEAEGRMEHARRDGAAGYSLSRHVELLIALLAEARLAMAGA